MAMMVDTMLTCKYPLFRMCCDSGHNLGLVPVSDSSLEMLDCRLDNSH